MDIFWDLFQLSQIQRIGEISVMFEARRNGNRTGC